MRAMYAVILAAWAAAVLYPVHDVWRAERAEQARIRTHLAGVEQALRARDVSSLTASQRAARTRNLDVLRAYWQAGRFPHNHDFADRREPYFIDAHGTRCAMAHLIERAGGEKLVQRVARTANQARVRQLAGDPELVAWLDREGMTASEAAWVQPAYEPIPGIIPSPLERTETRVPHEGVIVLETVGLALNVPRSWSWSTRRMAGIYGVAAGFSGLIFGMTQYADDPSLSSLETGLGIVTLAVAIHNLGHPPDANPVREVMAAHGWKAAPGVRVAPEGTPQLAVRVSF